MRVFADCRNRLNEPQFVAELDSDHEEVILMLLNIGETSEEVPLPSRDGEGISRFRVWDLVQWEGAIRILLVRAVPLH